MGTESDIPSMRLVEVFPMCQTSTGTTTATTNTSFRHRQKGGFISTSPIQIFSDSYVSATSSVELRVKCEDGYLKRQSQRQWKIGLMPIVLISPSILEPWVLEEDDRMEEEEGGEGGEKYDDWWWK